ncbi:MAG: hypothetical protein V4687_16070 [Bacteroidota bacterium]
MKINKKELAKIDLSYLADLITDDEARGFFILPEGREHYKLLAYLANQFDNIIISDIGSYKGCSALALSVNETNLVESYDVSDMVAMPLEPTNIQFFITDKVVCNQVLKSSLICLDTIHDGIHERAVIDFLIENNWKGLLILDDIHHFPEQNKLWNEITLRKEDLTSIGHWAGSGLIYFE